MRSGVPRPQIRWWAGTLLLTAAALAFDAVDRSIAFGVWTTGPVDEVAHLSTAALGLLVLARFIDAPRRFYVAALIASIAIDVDHIPLYLGLLGNHAHRPVTHSLSTVAVFAVAGAVNRRHRAVLAGAATGLVLHFARDIAEGYPGVRVFWPLQDTYWMMSYRWFLGMIVVFTTAWLVLASVGLPRTRIPVFRASSPSGSSPRSSDDPATSRDRRPDLKPQEPDLEATRVARSRTSLRNPPWCRDARGAAGSRSVGGLGPAADSSMSVTFSAVHVVTWGGAGRPGSKEAAASRSRACGDNSAQPPGTCTPGARWSRSRTASSQPGPEPGLSSHQVAPAAR
jgi:inner membrane protein